MALKITDSNKHKMYEGDSRTIGPGSDENYQSKTMYT